MLVPFFPNHLHNMFDCFFDVDEQKPITCKIPCVNIAETKDAFEVSIALPGVKKEQININVDDGKLVVHGEEKYENREDGKSYTTQEFGYHTFERKFYLPPIVDTEKLKAVHKDGVVSIHIPKQIETIEKPKKAIEIN